MHEHSRSRQDQYSLKRTKEVMSMPEIYEDSDELIKSLSKQIDRQTTNKKRVVITLLISITAYL